MRTNVVDPDTIDIPEWNIHLFFRNEQNLTVSVIDGKVYVYKNGEHRRIRWKVKSKNGIDARIWLKQKLISTWTEGGNVWKAIWKIKEALKSGDFIKWDDEQSIDISDFQFIIKGPKKFTFDEIKQFIENEHYPDLLDNCYYRPFHIILPSDKKLYLNKEYIINIYKENEKFWTDKIGSLDVAEWHLLMYEE